MRQILFLLWLSSCFSLNAQNWYKDFEKAKLDLKDNQKIVLVFQGSDWCAPCIKLDKSIWRSEKFQKLSENQLLLVKIDFPRKKKNQLTTSQMKHNKNLAEMYNSKGFFPHVVVVDRLGNVLGRLGYEKLSPEQYFNKIMNL